MYVHGLFDVFVCLHVWCFCSPELWRNKNTTIVLIIKVRWAIKTIRFQRNNIYSMVCWYCTCVCWYIDILLSFTTKFNILWCVRCSSVFRLASEKFGRVKQTFDMRY